MQLETENQQVVERGGENLEHLIILFCFGRLKSFSKTQKVEKVGR